MGSNYASPEFNSNVGNGHGVCEARRGLRANPNPIPSFESHMECQVLQYDTLPFPGHDIPTSPRLGWNGCAL